MIIRELDKGDFHRQFRVGNDIVSTGTIDATPQNMARLIDKINEVIAHINQERSPLCPSCGDNRTGKGSLIYRELVFCNDACFNKWAQTAQYGS